MAFRSLLGLRSPVHTIVRHLNPFDAPCQTMGVAHPLYRGLHQGAARLLGLRQFAVFKGDGGEAERVPEKPCLVTGFDGWRADRGDLGAHAGRTAARG